MNNSISDQMAEVLGPALALGSATRTDLLAAAVTARTPTPVIQILLALPERCYHNIDDVRTVLAAPS